MPNLVNSSQFTVHRILKTMNREPLTINRKSKGFTLIELLVVIAIIGILATFVVASFTSAQQRGRDSRRKADLDALKKALTLAKQDSAGASYYPFCTAAAPPCGLGATTPVLTAGTTPYIRAIPPDPAPGTCGASYSYYTGPSGCRTTNTCTDFRILACLENANDPNIAQARTKCPSPGGIENLPNPYAGTMYPVCAD